MVGVMRERHWLRAVKTLRGVLPSGVDFEHEVDTERVVVGGQPLHPVWIGTGNLGDARKLVDGIGDGDADLEAATVAVARCLSPGARETLSAAGVGWVDEATGSILVSHPGQPAVGKPQLERWTPAVLAVGLRARPRPMIDPSPRGSDGPLNTSWNPRPPERLACTIHVPAQR